jgi:hypothetical protein
VPNRPDGRSPIFAAGEDARRFVATLAEAVERWPQARLLAWCVMPSQWHLVLWPAGVTPALPPPAAAPAGR